MVIDDLAERFRDLPTGAWQRPPTQAVVVPLTSSGSGARALAGFLVVGLNPHRPFDEGYRGFVDLVASQIASALVNADSYEAERRRAEALAELDRAKTEFFSNVSHEFRTPLTLIMGPLAELRATAASRRPARSGRRSRSLTATPSGCAGWSTRCSTSPGSRPAGSRPLYEPVDLGALTAELASMFRSAVGARGAATSTSIAPRFRSRCSSTGTCGRRSFSTSCRTPSSSPSRAPSPSRCGGATAARRSTVRDTGIGIPREELPRLFERFHRIRHQRSRTHEGTGIGLALVRELVRLHGGTIEAQSTEGEGTTFTVRLRAGSRHLPQTAMAGEPPPAQAGAGAQPFVEEALRWTAPVTPVAGDGRRERVLLAEDNADMREYVTRLLAPTYDVDAVSDGLAALETARANPPALVLADVMMPGLDGYGLVQELRGNQDTATLPVVLLSARAGEESRVEGIKAGADDYLVKPFTARELLARVGTHLNLGRARRAAEERFTAMADLAPALIWVADPDGRRVFVNRGWAEFTGGSVGDALGRGWEDQRHPEDEDRYREVVAAAAERHEGWEVEFRLLRSDGAYHWLLERAVPIGSGKTFAGFVGS